MAQPPELRVRVALQDHGTGLPGPLSVDGELLGQRASAQLPGGVPAGAGVEAELPFAVAAPTPGVHALALHLRYPQGEGRVSQRAWVFVTFGPAPPPSLEITAAALRFETTGSLHVALRNTGPARTVAVRVLVPDGLRALQEGVSAELPAGGSAAVEVPLIRTSYVRPAEHGVVALAEGTVGGVHEAVAATALVSIAPDAAWMPRLRLPLGVLAVVLLGAALWVEWQRWSSGC